MGKSSEIQYWAATADAPVATTGRYGGLHYVWVAVKGGSMLRAVSLKLPFDHDGNTLRFHGAAIGDVPASFFDDHDRKDDGGYTTVYGLSADTVKKVLKTLHEKEGYLIAPPNLMWKTLGQQTIENAWVMPIGVDDKRNFMVPPPSLLMETPLERQTIGYGG